MIKEIVMYFAIYLGLFITIFYVLSLLSYSKTEKESKFPEKTPPMVSIIIPAFNEQKGIETTIKSALSLDYPEEKLEIIVIDDGSRDKTYEIASKFKSKRVKVFRHKTNKGKGVAMNLAISKAKGEFIVTMDADNTIVTKDALKKIIAGFHDKRVMCVAPSMAVYKPKGILQRVQQIEYLLGVYLRKAFASINAMHITPGAFSAYRKSFFDKYGGFDENNLTEDMEMCLKIQYHHFIVENKSDAVIYTIVPNKFIPLLKQRRRWYVGLMKNFWNYRCMFSKRYGAMGIIVLPLAIISVAITMFLTSIVLVETLIKIKDEIVLLQGINFNFASTFEFNKYVIERYIFMVLSEPIIIFSILLLILFTGYMIFAKRYVKEHANVKLSLVFFVILFSLLFSFWWFVSIIYTAFNKKVSWR